MMTRTFRPNAITAVLACFMGLAPMQPGQFSAIAQDAPPHSRQRPAAQPPRDLSDPQERARALSEMLATLAAANDVAVANEVAKSIESLWRAEGGDTVNLLLDRALAVAGEKRFDLAEKLIEAASNLAPGYAETWTRRAFVSLLKDDRDRAIADLRRALDGEPNHFRSIDALAKLLRESGDTRGALDMYRRLVKIYPLVPGARQAVSDLTRDVGDRGI